jgi:hypothetical protein
MKKRLTPTVVIMHVNYRAEFDYNYKLVAGALYMPALAASYRGTFKK